MIHQNYRNNIVKFDSELAEHARRVNDVERLIERIVNETVLKPDIWFEAIVNILTKDLD